jgi:hypothetical protein
MDPSTQAAIIGAGAAILTTLVKDISLPYLKHRKSKSDEIKSLTERYSYPLANSALSLFYRLREMIVDQRHDYLKQINRTNTFNEYKFNSSVYRLASLIGWIRALKLEQSSILLNHSTRDSTLSHLVAKFESSLADGPHVEVAIIRGLSSLWAIDLPSEPGELASIARKCDQARNLIFGNTLRDSSKAELKESIRDVANALCSCTRSQFLSDEILFETIERAKNILSPKQALIYRDWQSAIGDTVIYEAKDSIRKFDVIGYAEFESKIESKNKWINIVIELFNDVDLNCIQNDYRVKQLYEILRASSSIIIEINNLDIDSKPFTVQNINDAKRVIEN